MSLDIRSNTDKSPPALEDLNMRIARGVCLHLNMFDMYGWFLNEPNPSTQLEDFLNLFGDPQHARKFLEEYRAVQSGKRLPPR
jgi:hypothetical protein